MPFRVVWGDAPNMAGFCLAIYKGSSMSLQMYRVPDGEIIGSISHTDIG